MTRRSHNIGPSTSDPTGGMSRPPAASPSTSLSTAAHSPWHSPVPYLFGGLAAMLALITVTLLILACSYWKRSGYPRGVANDDGDVENGNGESGKAVSGGHPKGVAVLEEKVLVIMAGQHMPTFLATPVSSSAGCSKVASLGDKNKDGETAEDVGTGEGKEEGSKVTGGSVAVPATAEAISDQRRQGTMQE